MLFDSDQSQAQRTIQSSQIIQLSNLKALLTSSFPFCKNSFQGFPLMLLYPLLSHPRQSANIIFQKQRGFIQSLSAHNIFSYFRLADAISRAQWKVFWGSRVSSLYFQAFIIDPEACRMLQCARKQESYMIPMAPSPAPILPFSVAKTQQQFFLYFTLTQHFKDLEYQNFQIYLVQQLYCIYWGNWDPLEARDLPELTPYASLCSPLVTCSLLSRNPFTIAIVFSEQATQSC